jgi:hypothetical protein
MCCIHKLVRAGIPQRTLDTPVVAFGPEDIRIVPFCAFFEEKSPLCAGDHKIALSSWMLHVKHSIVKPSFPTFPRPVSHF